MGYRNSLKEDYEFEVSKNDQGGYEVDLPHQCDDWKILGFDGTDLHKGYGDEDWEIEGQKVQGTYPSRPTNKEFAVKQMELFVKRAVEALEELKKF